jgi:hypothetical protein
MRCNNRLLPQFVSDLLSSPPSRGTGLNNWLYRVARVLHPYRNEQQIVELLHAAVAGESIKPGEIERAVARSRETAWQPGTVKVAPRRETWPKLNQELRAEVCSKGITLSNLCKASPYRLEENKVKTEEIIDLLFPGNPLLCCGESVTSFATKSRAEWKGKLATLAHIVPNPMTAREGVTQDGKPSAHTLQNTGSRRYLVIEFDSGIPDDQAAILLHLASRAPLAVAVFSGQKSIHGWFASHEQSESKLRTFMAYAVSMGADPALWTRSQFTRMPDGLRQTGERQWVYFLNPKVIR